MGRTNKQTTSRRTKTQRHQTKTTINLTNVGQPINLTPQTNPTHITKTRPQNLNRLLITRRLTTRLQTTLTPQISRHTRERINNPTQLKPWNLSSITQPIHKKQTNKTLKRNPLHLTQIQQTILNKTRNRNSQRHHIFIKSTLSLKPHQNPSQPKYPSIPRLINHKHQPDQPSNSLVLRQFLWLGLFLYLLVLVLAVVHVVFSFGFLSGWWAVGIFLGDV